MRKCAIIAGGDMPDNKEYDITVRRECYGHIICADSGLYNAEKFGIKPDIIIGDFDSYKDELPEDTEIISALPEKDDTDTLLAVKRAIELGYNNIDLYGALGGERFEHSIANIQTMIYALQQGCDLKIYGNSTLSVQTADDGEIHYRNSKCGVYLSVFSLSETVGIDYIRGVKYPLEKYLMVQSFPIGVGNEIIGEAAIRIKHGLALIIITDKK